MQGGTAMKVDVVTVDEAKFKYRWSWFSNWIDVAIFNFGGYPLLIQMQVDRMNKKIFRTVKISAWECQLSAIESLTQMGKTVSPASMMSEPCFSLNRCARASFTALREKGPNDK
jgi:hypothetical protein